MERYGEEEYKETKLGFKEKLKNIDERTTEEARHLKKYLL